MEEQHVDEITGATGSTIEYLMSRIREIVNRTRFLNTLLERKDAWDMLCSSMDVIEDTTLALDAYSKIENEEPGALYLLVYGLLQALETQQDAIESMHKSLNIDYKHCDEFTRIRLLRNRSIAHPTNQSRNTSKYTTFNHISRPTLTLEGFDLHTYFSDDSEPDFNTIKLHETVSNQKGQVLNILSELIRTLTERELAHRSLYRSKKIINCFPSTINYDFQQLRLICRGQGRIAMGSYHIRNISEAFLSYRTMLQQRNCNDLEDADMIFHCIEQLELYVSRNPSVEISGYTAYILCFFLEAMIEENRVIANEIDLEYQSDIVE